MLNKLRQRRLPSLLSVVVDLPELLRVHPEFSRHLNLRVGETMPPSCLNPQLQVCRYSPLGRHLAAPFCSLFRGSPDAGLLPLSWAENVYHLAFVEDDGVFFTLRIVEMDRFLHTGSFDFPDCILEKVRLMTAIAFVRRNGDLFWHERILPYRNSTRCHSPAQLCAKNAGAMALAALAAGRGVTAARHCPRSMLDLTPRV